MATSLPISGLPVAGPLAANNLFATVQNDITKQVDLAGLIGGISGSIPAGAQGTTGAQGITGTQGVRTQVHKVLQGTTGSSRDTGTKVLQDTRVQKVLKGLQVPKVNRTGTQVLKVLQVLRVQQVLKVQQVQGTFGGAQF